MADAEETVYELAAVEVFGLTLNKNSKLKLVYIEEIPSMADDDKWEEISLLERAIFERLLLENPELYVTEGSTASKLDPHFIEKKVVPYLFECFKRLSDGRWSKKFKPTKINEVKALVIRNAATAIRQPVLYDWQNVCDQVVQLFTDCDDFLKMFIDEIVDHMSAEATPLLSVTVAFLPTIEKIRQNVKGSTLLTLDHRTVFTFLDIVASNKTLAHVFLHYCSPTCDGATALNGKQFSDSFLGEIISISCLPKNSREKYEYFDKPLMQPVENEEASIWTSLKLLYDNLHQVFLKLLKVSPNVKQLTLRWLGDCITANASRGKLWNMHMAGSLDQLMNDSASDAFMLNLNAVMLKLCEPFIKTTNDDKILKIDPTYCALKVIDEKDSKAEFYYLSTIHEETCFLPVEEGEIRPVSEEFKFITECFFMTQKSLDLGFRVCSEKLTKLYQDLGRLQKLYNESVSAGGTDHEVAKIVEDQMQKKMTKYLSLKAVMLEPNTMQLLLKNCIALSRWLVQVVLDNDNTIRSSYLIQNLKTVTFPLSDTIPNTLKCLPEFLITHLTYFVSFLRKYDQNLFEEYGFQALEPLITLIIVYMGSTRFLQNPHLRAGLAECMEYMLPKVTDIPGPPNSLGTFYRQKIFETHEHKDEIIPSLLDVFVGIETTGQSVQFEQKFNYRRPMHAIMDYLWEIEDHRKCFKRLAANAEKNMEAVTPPLFLRFLNLLINDAVYLLDETLSKMAQLKTLQVARDNGDWKKLPINEREQNEALFQHTGLVARFDNVLGKWTIHTLEYLTSEIKSIFLHRVMVDRIAAMLNYFLLNLVGPKKKNFNVKDREEYDFVPALLVTYICKIYVHLGQSDVFCKAVSQDGRSYSSSLFVNAYEVLGKIKEDRLKVELNVIGKRVLEISNIQQTEDEILVDAPEEFLDPIMSTLMIDPVILPSSRIEVDRATIARHLLSDQSDPFNREPLTMEMLIPAHDLKKRIQEWVTERKENYKRQTKE